MSLPHHSTPLILITGATGFIGSQVVLVSLRAGYRVRLAIRKPEQEAVLRARYPDYNDQIEISIITDITVRDAFKPALAGVDYVFHLASPMPGRGSDLQADYIDPAVKGTESVLFSALAFPQIKKVIIVSSVLALVPPTALQQKEVFVKDNTNEVIPIDMPTVIPEGPRGHGLKYSASKICAHQATRDFLARQNPHFTIITLHPTFVLGESLVQETPEGIDGINALFWNSLRSEKPTMPNVWVDVRDVAEAHLRALKTGIPSGTEFLLSAPAASWEEVSELVRRKFPFVGCKLEGPIEGGWTVDTRTAERMLGMNWRRQDEIVEAMLEQQLRLREVEASL
ncbi:NAD dependent epimerase/dehydratase family protein [Aspergillus parasiticus SU-1]|uniref:NAD dependent epimerase/dehydratase family protein n=1 Tax=Aspergillus parasiticus (strain ATCC 56775 / NRRL 5862 / SRRC 143 / SU-1) TaxID=1403190 RepID=A0A0F0IIQ9_ASPPU|nr:NAD dependent epimerase/dehydratase family protein [Aspergillus parasiticus SU-1]